MKTTINKLDPRYFTGKGYSPEARTWRSMMLRCYKNTYTKYWMYGARGITVCDRWHDFHNFYDDMGLRPDGKTIDRINGKLGYFPENCRWATHLEQQANLKNNINITWNGKTQNVAAWSRELGFGGSMLWKRLLWGWPIEKALTMPSNRHQQVRSSGRKGELSGNAKLTNKMVLAIRGSNKLQRELAEEFGVSQSVISMVKLRQIWTHI